MDTAHGWVKQTLAATGRVYYYHTGRKESRIDPPYYEILDLDPSKCEKYGKSDIQLAWFKRSKNSVNESDMLLIREAYEVLRYTSSRMDYNYRNILSVERMHNNSALQTLRVMRVIN